MQTTRRSTSLIEMGKRKHTSLLPLLLSAILWATGKAEDPRLSGTSLELLITRAFNGVVASDEGSAVENLLRQGLYPDIYPQSSCLGNLDQYPEPTVTPGSDLERVVNKQTFTCAYNQNSNFSTSSGADAVSLIQTGTTSDSVSGLVPDIFAQVVDWINENAGLANTIELEWKLFPSSQASFEALLSGEVDALCGYWSPEGTWVDESGLTKARASYFSAMACPSFLASKYVYLANDRNSSTFDELVSSLTEGDTVCVTGTQGGGFQQACQSTFRAYGAPIDCVGYSSQSFNELQGGNCVAVWDGVPPSSFNYSRVPFPFLDSPVTFFRPVDLTTSPVKPIKTTLELAVTHAYEAMIASGLERELLPDQGGEDRQGYCLGAADAWLPLPEPSEGSDLKAVLDRGTFRCGDIGDTVIPNQLENLVLVDNTDPSNVTGVGPTLWARTVEELGKAYNTELKLEWAFFESSQESFDALYNGAVDSLCVYWTPWLSWTPPTEEETVGRTVAFSLFQCPFLYQSTPLVTSSTISTWRELYEAANRSTSPFNVCVNGIEGENLVTDCEVDLNFGSTEVWKNTECIGAPVDLANSTKEEVLAWAFANLEAGNCSAIYNAESKNTFYNTLFTVNKNVAGSFFRTFNIGDPEEVDGSDPPGNESAARFLCLGKFVLFSMAMLIVSIV